MTLINDVYSYLCELAPLKMQMGFDNAGFQLGRGGRNGMLLRDSLQIAKLVKLHKNTSRQLF